MAIRNRWAAGRCLTRKKSAVPSTCHAGNTQTQRGQRGQTQTAMHTHPCTHTHAHTPMHTHTHTHTHTTPHTHTCTHTHMHTHTHIHIHRSSDGFSERKLRWMGSIWLS